MIRCSGSLASSCLEWREDSVICSNIYSVVFRPNSVALEVSSKASVPYPHGSSSSKLIFFCGGPLSAVLYDLFVSIWSKFLKVNLSLLLSLLENFK